jgi:hypothetical protein
MDKENYANRVGFLYETGEGADAMVFAVNADLLTPEGKLITVSLIGREAFAHFAFSPHIPPLLQCVAGANPK